MCVSVEPTINEHFDPWLLVRELDSEIKRLKQVEFIRTICKKIFLVMTLRFSNVIMLESRLEVSTFFVEQKFHVQVCIVATKNQKKQKRMK